jgi:F-type H+-transporting ATPase subunit a
MLFGSHLLSAPLVGIDITPGVHPQVKLGGLTFDVDIIWATFIAGAIVVIMGMVLRAKATSGVPGKFQLLWEMAVGAIQKQVNDTIGPRGAQVVPLALTLFIFIFTCNLFEVLSIGSKYDWLPAPTSDVNLPLAMAVTVIALVHYNSIRTRGFKGYVKHYFTPYAFLFPINVIEEITKPITMTFRLFGNIFSGVLMITVIVTLIPPYLSWIGLVIWKPFDELFIGAIQAFIFALLTIMYLGMGMSTEDHSP